MVSLHQNKVKILQIKKVSVENLDSDKIILYPIYCSIASHSNEVTKTILGILSNHFCKASRNFNTCVNTLLFELISEMTSYPRCRLSNLSWECLSTAVNQYVEI